MDDAGDHRRRPYLLISERLRTELTALLVLLSLSLLGILTPEQTLLGFSRSAVITILSMFSLSHALDRTGVTLWIGQQVLGIVGPHPQRLRAALMLAAAGLSGIGPTVLQTGELRARSTRMSKRGSHYLSRSIWQAAQVAARDDPALKPAFEAKRRAGKHHFAAVGAIPLVRNRRRRIRLSLLSGDPYTSSNDAPCSGGDGGTCLAAMRSSRGLASAM